MIEVENLRFAYPKTAGPVLEGLSFSIAAGEVYGLLGPSGAGKSTTQRILMGLLRGYTGKAEVFGRPLGALGGQFYERIGVSFELPTLYLRLTARENLTLFASLYDRPTRDPAEVLALVDLVEDANKRVEAFSKGMKMRLNLCRALLHDPELLFLDEPTTGQDPTRARTTRELIKRLRTEGKTVFLTTHNMAEADEICDRVGFLANGHIPVTGAPAELRRRFGKRLLEVTAGGDGALETRTFPMDGIGANAEFLALLKAGHVASMHTLEASLDDVFIKATRAPDA
ncbi:MAG TPA: ABC transporter ATP-binding protein [Devosiaceae bacterium]|nr:ABC transporter ATP-binding protein [Devosiaceae bacterium]